MDKNEITQLIQEQIKLSQNSALYGASNYTFHTHNNLDSPVLPLTSIGGFPSSYSGQAGKTVIVNASASGLVFSAGSNAAGGSNTQIQYNNSGALAGSANFTWDNTNKILQLASAATIKTLPLASNTNQTRIEITPAASTGTGLPGDVVIRGGFSSTSTGGGDVYIVPGKGTGSVDNGYVIIGNGVLPTTSNYGFLVLPQVNGTPTGAPQAGSLVYDGNTSKLWIYTGLAWKSVTLT